MGRWFVYLCCALGLQWLNGAFTAEFSSYADSPGHFVSAVMVREYVLGGFAGDPLAFAADYYVHYPSIGIGRWPPAFHGLLALWMLPVGPSRVGPMVLQALLLALGATCLHRLASREIGRVAATAVSLLFVISPIAQTLTAAVMAEPLLLLCCVAAVACYRSYLDEPRMSASVGFGLLAGAALLTKGLAIVLAFLPVAAIALGRVRLIKRADFWVPAFVVIAIAGPWYFGMSQLLGDVQDSTAGDAVTQFSLSTAIGNRAPRWSGWAAALSRSSHLPGLIGYGASLLAIVGLYVRFVRPVLGRTITTGWAVSGVYLLSALCLHVALPESDSPRHIFHAVPVVLMFGYAGVCWLADRILKPSRLAGHASAAALAALVALFVLEVWSLQPREQSTGLGEAAAYLLSRPELDDAVVMVSSSSTGESTFIAEAAVREPTPRRVIVRAMKALALASWGLRFYRQLYADADEVASYLESIPIGVVVLDDRTPGRTIPHHGQLIEAIERHPDRWTEVALEDSGVRFFRSTREDLRQRRRIEINMKHRVGRVLIVEPPE